MTREAWVRVMVCAAVFCLAKAPAVRAVSNNGFETDYEYIAREPASGGEMRTFRKSDGTLINSLFLPSASNWESVTFSGTTSSDARMFVTKENGSDVQVAEIDSTGATINSKMLSTLGITFGTAPLAGTIRYQLLTNTLMVSVNPDSTSPTNSIATVYELDLALTTLIHTYVGPSIYVAADPRAPFIAVNARNGVLYMIGRSLGFDSSAGQSGLGSLVSFTTAGRVVGGTTTAYTVLIKGTVYNPVNTQYSFPQTVIYRQRSGTGSDDTVIIPNGQDSNARPIMEFWLNTASHPSGNANYLLLRGNLFGTGLRRGWNGQQDRATSNIWIAALRGGFHELFAGDTTSSFDTGRNYIDAATPLSPPQAPAIATVTPNPDTALPGTPYVFQLSLTAGTPPVTWSLLQGPPGASVDSSGKVTGWTPAPADAGQFFTFSVKATNFVGSNTATWQVKVIHSNNGFATDYVFVTREYTNGAQTRKYNKYTGVNVADLLPDGTNWQSLTFSGKGKGNDARLFLAQPSVVPPGTSSDIVIAEIDANGNTLNTANLSTIIGGTVGANVALGNIRYSVVSDTLFVSLTPDQGNATTAVAYEINLGLTTRIHTYLGEAVATGDVRGAAVGINSRDGTLYMTDPFMGDASATGLGDVIAFNTAGRAVGGTTTTFTVLIHGQSENAGNSSYSFPSSPIFRRSSSLDDTLEIPTDVSSTATPVLEFYLNTTLHPLDGNGNLTQRGTQISVARGWNGQQDVETHDVWLAGDRGGFHVIRSNDLTASFELSPTLRFWMDAAVPPYQPCNTPSQDVDGDGDVDMDDFAVYQRCYTGVAAGSPLSVPCLCFDTNGDTSIDTADFNAFAACGTGAGVIWQQSLTPNCITP